VIVRFAMRSARSRTAGRALVSSWLYSLDLTVSGRYEHYSDFGSKTYPRWSCTYDHLAQVAFNLGKASEHQTYTTFMDTILIAIDLQTRSPPRDLPVLIRSGGTPNLQPETAESWISAPTILPRSEWITNLDEPLQYPYRIEYQRLTMYIPR